MDHPTRQARRILMRVLPFALCLSLAPLAQSQDNSSQTAVEIILDASGSMLAVANGEVKIETAKKMLKLAIESIDSDNAVSALRVFGHRRAHDCNDIEEFIGFYKKDLPRFRQRVSAIRPAERGMTPLAKSLEMAAKSLATHTGPKRVIVITDGVETCHGDPCKVAAELKEKYDIKIYVLSYGAESEDQFKELECMGQVTKANSPEDFQQKMSDIKMDALQTQQTILIRGPKPEIWATAVSTRDAKRQFRFVSSMGINLAPDTYNIKVDYNPPISFKNVQLKKGEKKTLVIKGNGLMEFNFPFDDIDVVAESMVDGKKFPFHPKEKRPIPTGRYNVVAATSSGLAFQWPSITITPGSSENLSQPNWGMLLIGDNKNQSFDLFMAESTQPGLNAGINKERAATVKKVTAFDDSLGFFITNSPYVVEAGKYRVILKDGKRYDNVVVAQGKTTQVGSKNNKLPEKK